MLFGREAEKMDSNYKWLPFIRIQKLSEGVISRCFRDTLETVHKK